MNQSKPIEEATEKLNSMTSAAENTASALRRFGASVGKATKGLTSFWPISGVDGRAAGFVEDFYLINDPPPELFKLFFLNHQMKSWKMLNPNRRIPGSNRIKRLRKKRAKALANPLNNVKLTKKHSCEAVDTITKIKAVKAAFDKMQEAKRRAAKAKRKAAFYCKNQRVNSILAHYALYKDRKK